MAKLSRRELLVSGAAASIGANALLSRKARAAAQLRLKVYSNQPVSEYSTQYLWFKKFEANLREAVGDQIALDFFPSAILGKETDAIQQVKLGVIDVMIQNSGVWMPLCPEIGVFDLCYLFDSEDHQARAMDGKAGAIANKLLYDQHGVSTIAWTFHSSARSLFTKGPIKSMAELKGRKIRVFATKVFLDAWKIMGAVPTPIPFNELYSALQTGVVEGFDNDYGSIIGMKLYEQTKFCFETKHEFMAMCAYIGKPSWDRIPADLHQPFMKAAVATTTAHRIELKQLTQRCTDDLKRLGVTFTPMPAEQRKTVAQDMQTQLWGPFGQQYPATKPIIDSIIAARSV
jgi:tripartite ATP-independent transporter DctP family solute receptor